MIPKHLAIEILNTALATGGDYAEIFQEEGRAHTIQLSYRRVEALATRLSSGIGIRILKDGKSVYGYTSDLTSRSLLALAAKLAASFTGEPRHRVESLNTAKRGKTINKVKKSLDSMSDSEIIELFKKVEKAGYDVSPNITNMLVSLSIDSTNVAIYNSDLLVNHDERSNARLAVAATAKTSDGRFARKMYAPGIQGGLEVLDLADLEAEAKKLAAKALEQAVAPDSPSGVMTVVIGNAFGGTLFHEACGHPLEATAIAHNRSSYVGKIGEKIASDVVTAIDDGTIDGSWGSINCDDEGHASTCNVLIEKGVLKNYMVDRFNGEKIGLPATGACRRESYRYEPTSRMTNTYIANGDSTFEEIIKSVDKGIYCKTFRGGSVDPATNNFNFSSDEVYLIENGAITTLVQPVILVGYGYDILKKIDMVGNDLVLAAGNCGAESGSVPVCVGQPTVRIQGIVVGGSAKEER